jgi:biofilm protein TabA
MLLCSIADFARNHSLHPAFPRAGEFLRRADLATLEPGRFDLLPGDDLFALLQENLTRPVAQCRWESHRTYGDIQFVITGVEAMGVLTEPDCALETPYDAARDVAFWTARSGSADTTLMVPAGHLAVFLPHDIHRPLMTPPGHAPANVRKVVIKFRV